MERDERATPDGALAPSTGLARSSAVIGAGTALSRLTGLLRTMVTAGVLGAAAAANSYNLANTTPNIVYDLMLGGVLAATMIPVFVDLHARDDADGESSVVTVATVVLIAVSLAVVVAAPIVFAAYTSLTPAGAADEVTALGVPLLRLFAFQILFYGLAALFSAVLNTRRRFAAAAFAPVVNNMVVIVVMLAFGRMVGSTVDPGAIASNPSQLWLLGAGTTLGIAVQAAVLWPAMRRAGVRLRWRFAPSAPAVRRVARLSGWTFAYVTVNVITLFIVLALATRVGGVSAYTYAYVFFQLPYGLFAVSVMTAATPRLAACVSADDMDEYRDVFSKGLRGLVITIIPASVGLAVLARPLVGALLEFRNFTAVDADVTAQSISAFAVGLIGFSVYLFCLRGFYAFTDTRTPFMLCVLQNAMNLVFAVAFLDRWGTSGLALAFALSYLLAAVVAMAALVHRSGGVGGSQVWPTVVRTVVATGAMAVVVCAVTQVIGSDRGAGAWVQTAVGVFAGGLVFLAAATVLRIEGVREAMARLPGE